MPIHEYLHIFSKMYAYWFAGKFNYAKMKKNLFGEVIDQGTF